MSTEALSLNQLVDLALGTPDVGAVNFNVLHTLLHAVINKLDIGAVKAEISEADKNYLALNRDGSLLSAPSRASTVGKDSGLDTDGESGREDTSGIIPHRHSHHHLLEKKVAKLEDKLNSLDKLPSNEDLFNSTKGQGKKNAVSEMWQNMQLAKRVDANEGGVSKLMSMVEDLLRDMAELKEENENIKRQIAGLDVDDLRDRLKALEDTTDSLNKKFEELPRMPGQDFWDAFVTWEGLENALRGIREDLAPVPATVIEMSVQTDPPRPASNRPSKELADLLEKLGLLTKEHDLLSGRVDKLEEDMENKADRSELDAIKVPDELLDILKKLQMDMDALNKNRERDTDALNRAHRAISNLQTELEKLKSTTEFLVDENTSKTEQLSSLVTATQQLEEKKADREYVEAGLDLKADKQALDAKVNRSQFETTIADLNKMIDDILAKLEGHDEEWRRAIAELTKELDCKIDRLELDALKDYLESRLKALSNKIKASNADILTDDDAAGIRKQLLQRYNCISCDRPVDMYPHGPAAALPAPGPMPGMKSARPYTTFELEQIRQQAKLNRGGRGACNYERAVFERELGRLRRYDLRSYMAYFSRRAPNFGGPEAAELYSTARSCGGTHTMTYPHRRITRLNQLATLFHEDDPATSPVPQPSLNREELDIMGADGHIYKGRFDKIDSQRLPSVKQQPHMVRTTSPRLERAKTTVSPASRQVDVSPRPLSARHSRTQMDDRPRPASARIPSPQEGGDERPNTPATQKAE